MSIAIDSPSTPGTYAVSASTLAKASGTALLVALLVLLLFVLPAERGIDPTGLGARLGLTQMRGGEDAADGIPKAAVEPPSAAASAAVAVEPQAQANIQKATPLRSDEMTVTLKAHSGMEIKAEMKTGDHFIFQWEASAPLKMDMHGEKPDDGDRFTRYWMQSDMNSAQGSFTAPFDGHHGWYWRNRGDTDVTLKIRTSGFYEKLYIPK